MLNVFFENCHRSFFEQLAQFCCGFEKLCFSFPNLPSIFSFGFFQNREFSSSHITNLRTLLGTSKIVIWC